MTKKGHFTTTMFAHMPIIRDIVYGAASHGADFQTLCRLAKIDPTHLNDSERRLNFESAYQVWEMAVKMTGDKMLGLHLGESANPSILGLVGHLMQSSQNLNEAFQKVSQYSKLATDMFRYGIRKQGSQYILHYQPASLWTQLSPDSARQAVEQAMAGTLNVFYLLTRTKINPVHVNFGYRRPGPLSEYERVFSCSVKFNAAVNELIFDQKQLEQQVLSYDRSVYRLLDDMLQKKVKALKENLRFSQQLEQIILSDFKGQVPPVEVIASFLNLTTRSLQRKLALEKLTYRTLSAKIKKELAVQWLGNKETKVSQVANLLGYSEPSAFRRAYKKWMKT